MLVGTFTFYDESDLMVHQLETMLSICDAIVMQSDSATDDCLQIAEAYEDNDTVHLIRNVKADNFNQRDEVGDRQRLLDKARELGATTCYHTDVDEIISTRCVPLFNDILNEYKNDKILRMYRYDLWDNAHNYRLPRSGKDAGKVIDMVKPPVDGGTSPYIFPVLEGSNYTLRPVPNFHSPRFPSMNLEHEVCEGVDVIHYGYYKNSLIKKKENFYQTNPVVTHNSWGPDMQVTAEEYISQWGMGNFLR